MSGAGGKDRNQERDRNAEALLAQLLGDSEWMTVLEYSRANALDSDSAVFFLVSLLKLFALAYNRILEALSRVTTMRSEIETAAFAAEIRLDSMFEKQRKLIEAIMEEHTQRMSVSAASFAVTTGEVKLLREMLEANVRDAQAVVRALAELKGEEGGSSMRRLFQDRLDKALAARVPAFDQVFRQLLLETIHIGMGKYIIIVQIEFIAVALAGLAMWHWAH